jgi:predicted amidohydrolase YtcJ
MRGSIFKVFLVILFTLSGISVFSPLEARPPAPDTIFIGHFITLDRAHPEAEAIAVSSGRIVGVGSRSQVESLADKNTKRINFSGVGLPGFADAHVHVEGTGEQLEKLDLRGLTKAKILTRIAEAARVAPPGEWISGGGWDQGFWQPPEFPTAKELDAVSGDHPVILERIDGHSTWMNSKVLTLANITRDTPDPDGGLIRRDSAHEPSGMLVDHAQGLIRNVIPKPSPADRERQIRAALRQFSRWGLTSVHDAGVDLDTIAIYKDLLKRGELPVRVYAMARGEAAMRHYLESGPEHDLGGDMLAVRSFKLILDGALGSRGAEMTDPYSDAPKDHGLELVKDAELDEIVKAARQKGFQVNTHAIGDRAVTRALNAFQKGGVTPQERFRVEHASVVTNEDLSRFARYGIIASIQPVFVGEYGRWAEERVGPSRIHWMLRTRDFLNAGVALAAGSDYPASDSGDPIATLYCLVTGKSADGKLEAGWYRDQRVDVDQALGMMTAGPAFASFQENNLGALTIGRYADFTILSANPYNVPSENLRALTIRMTVVAGPSNLRCFASARYDSPLKSVPDLCSPPPRNHVNQAWVEFTGRPPGWRSGQSRANPSPAEFPANREKYREFANSCPRKMHPHLSKLQSLLQKVAV